MLTDYSRDFQEMKYPYALRIRRTTACAWCRSARCASATCPAPRTRGPWHTRSPASSAPRMASWQRTRVRPGTRMWSGQPCQVCDAQRAGHPPRRRGGHPRRLHIQVRAGVPRQLPRQEDVLGVGDHGQHRGDHHELLQRVQAARGEAGPPGPWRITGRRTGGRAGAGPGDLWIDKKGFCMKKILHNKKFLKYVQECSVKCFLLKSKIAQFSPPPTVQLSKSF